MGEVIQMSELREELEAAKAQIVELERKHAAGASAARAAMRRADAAEKRAAKLAVEVAEAADLEDDLREKHARIIEQEVLLFPQGSEVARNRVLRESADLIRDCA